MLIELNSVDITNSVDWKSLKIEQRLANQVDECFFDIFFDNDTKTVRPALFDEISITHEGETLFAGVVIRLEDTKNTSKSLTLSVFCSDYGYLLTKKLVSKSYESKTIKEIIDDINTNFLDSEFTTTGVLSSFEIDKIVFNQEKTSDCIADLATALGYYWYVGYDKNIHFFPKFSEASPYVLDETSGTYFVKSLKKEVDSSQIVNRVKVRGGEYDGETFTDNITVVGNTTKIFTLPYKFANIAVELNGTPQSVGIDHINDFTTDDVLYNYNEKTIQWENALTDADVITYSGNPKVPVLAVAEDAESIALYGVNEKIIRDNGIEDLQLARKRAEAELLNYALEAVNASLKTNLVGLKVGQSINISDLLADIDENLIIQKISIKLEGPTDPVFSVSLASSHYWDLIALLQKLLRQPKVKAGETEIAEVIKVNQGTVNVAELIVSVSAKNDNVSITITESVAKSDIEPTWVAGPYTPTSELDTKRTPRADGGALIQT